MRVERLERMKLGRALAAGVATVAVLNALSALSMPVLERKAPLLLVVAWLALLLLHAAVYEFGDAIRRRFDLVAYAGAQAAILFAIAVSRPPAPLTIVLYMAAIAEMVTIARPAWGTVPITIGAIVLFVLASLVTSDLYQAATAGLILAVTGLIAHAMAGLLHRPPPVVPPAESRNGQAASMTAAGQLSAREIEVLRELVRGARNSEIAERLNITERTVKAHLGSVYQKLGVESRAGAVAVAVQRQIV
jgi:DNA-binding CsgD family transcriptional regulator